MNTFHRATRLRLVLFLCTGLLSLCVFGPAQAQSLTIPQDQYAEVNGVRMQYLDWGGEGPLMLMIHGLWSTAHWYDELAPHFTDRYHVVGFTRREHGASQKGTGLISLDLLADDLSDFLRLFTSEPAVLVGHSYAGIEMPRLAREHPDQVAALILLDAVYDWQMWRRSDVPSFPALWNFPDGFTSFRSMDRWFATAYAQAWGDALVVALRSQTYLASDGSIRWHLPWQSAKGFEFQAPYDDWSEDAFADIEVPILSIQADFGGFFEREFERWQVSDEDQAIARAWAAFDANVKRRGREQLEGAAPHAEHQMLLDTHHWLFTQRPKEVAQRMDAFLSGH